MKLKYLLMIMLAGLLQTVDWAAPETSRQTSQPYSYDTYRIISQRNVFSRNRRPPQPAKDDRPAPKKAVVISLYVLKGIAANGPQKIAFIENEISGEFTQAAIGTPLENGTIKDIQYDYVVYEKNGQTRQMHIGDVFSKTETQVEVSSDSEEPAPTKTENQAETPSDESDILKKLMERRKGETGT